RARARTPIGDDLAAGPPGHLHRPRRGGTGDEDAVLGDEGDELAERGAYLLLVAEDVGVIELDRGEQRDLRAVVQELRALVEERRVVLIPFDHELRASAEAPRLPEVRGHAADQERRIPARVV